MLVLGGTALALFLANAARELIEITLALAGALGFILLREFARRFAFAHLRFQQALALDIAVALIHILLLALLISSGRLSAVTGLAALGLSCGIGGAAWLWLGRAQFSFCCHAFRATINHTWALGKWLLGGQLAIQVQSYTTYWLSMLIAGAVTTGVYAACISLIALANPLLFGFYNVLTPRSVRTLRNQGGSGLRREAARNALLLAALITPLCLLVIGFGENAMQILYSGKEFSGNGHVLAVLAISSLAAAIGAPASIALACAERGRAVAVVMIATSILNVLLVWLLIVNWGILGAAYGALIGEVLGSFARWAAFLALVPKHCQVEKT
jgi:O-antigen/teichoic acid export membrane protein